ncbi:hypothetical protein J437_LFUL013077 [Ladona fulva]|uniref:Uncharacterized protein n=1 Tax=Ladona fulva TaxID=123851 RepID=A0A8K0P4R6_LADFU|nr:hypothetical protein J437_LFUL013077 [Ladona fulva]
MKKFVVTSVRVSARETEAVHQTRRWYERNRSMRYQSLRAPIEGGQWVHNKPVSSLSDDAQIEFVVPGHGY